MQVLTLVTKLEPVRKRRVNKIAVIFGASLLLAGCGGSKVQGGGNPNPVKPGPDQKVHLVWKQATSEWKVMLNGGGEENPSTAKIALAKGIGPTMFLVDIQGSPVSFKDPGGLSVWTGDKSAPRSGINSTQILGPVVTKNGKQLIFWDLNQGDPVVLNYSLYLDSGPPVDPIIDNGGGTNSSS